MRPNDVGHLWDQITVQRRGGWGEGWGGRGVGEGAA